MARTWISITVELVEGQDKTFWPRPGRVFAAARSHSFAQLADAINSAFARWDLAHLNEFRLLDETVIGDPQWDDSDRDVLDAEKTKLSRLNAGERFLYVFDFGDGWHHICTVGDERIDPVDALGVTPLAPVPLWGWGDLPDQYGRRFTDDDGESELPPNPKRTDLPPFFPWWGDGPDRYPD